MSINPPLPPRARPRGSLARWLRRLALLGLVILVGLELFARFWLGLGDPVIYKTDPQIEYLQVPSQHRVRLGNHLDYNSFSMRAAEFPAKKADPNELRVMVLGDSIVNAGSRIDQPGIATELLRADLAQRLGRPVVVGNIASNSWGPPNVLAYVKRFGLFDADVVLVVINDGDVADVPTFEPLSAEFPQRTPVIALEEVARLWLPKLVDRLKGSPPPRPPPPQKDRDAAMGALRELVQLAQESGAKVAGIEFEGAQQIDGATPEGLTALGGVFASCGAPTQESAPVFRAERDRHPDQPLFLDAIHPNQIGQRLLARIMCEQVLQAIGEPARANSGPATRPAAGG